MTSSAFRQDLHTRYYFRFNSEVAGEENGFELALVVLALQTQADTAVVYRFDQESSEFRGFAAHADRPAAIRDAGVTLTQSASQWIFSLTEPEQGSASKEERFERFLERLQYGVDRVLVVPLRAKERLIGLLTLGRRGSDAFAPDVAEIARKAGRGLATVLERRANKKERFPAAGVPAELAISHR